MSKRSNCKKPKCQKWPITTFRRIQPNARRFDHNTLVNDSNPGTFVRIPPKVVGHFLAVPTVVGENIIEVFLAVPPVVGENILGVVLAVPRVVGENILGVCLAVPRVVGEKIFGVF